MDILALPQGPVHGRPHTPDLLGPPWGSDAEEGGPRPGPAAAAGGPRRPAPAGRNSDAGISRLDAARGPSENDGGRPQRGVKAFVCPLCRLRDSQPQPLHSA